ncbi:MAG: DUF11 domain-containing protein [Bacteroidetes bacterium]|jgi:uncharacterized repeat protein (TIGR01451 family)|nr:DUF11 domain-containing protein [Bacteroidota bacterium]
MRAFTLLLLVSLAVSVLPAQQDMSLAMPGYRVAIAGGLIEPANGGIVVAKLDSLPKQRGQARFGVLFREQVKTAARTPVLEFLDAATGKIISTVTLDEWQGRASATWQPLPEASSSTPEKVVDVYAVREGNASFTVTRTLEPVTAPYLPLGKGLRMTISIGTSSVPSLRAVFHGVVEGVARAQGRLLSISSAEKNVPMNASLMLHWSEGSMLRLDPASPNKPQMFAVSSGAVNLPGQGSIEVLSVRIAGSTSPVAEHQAAQAAALHQFAEGNGARPQFVARTLVDRPKAGPGDTVAYSLTYYNIGTASAVDVQLANPIPDGTEFLEGSEAGPDSDISVDREKATAPAVGRVTNLSWTFKGAIAPGEERWASFKVILK